MRAAGPGARWGGASRPERDLPVRLGVAAFAAASVMTFAAALYAGWAGGMEERFVALFRWTSLALATPVALWSAAPFFAGAAAGLHNGLLRMDVPAALVAFGTARHARNSGRVGRVVCDCPARFA